MAASTNNLQTLNSVLDDTLALTTQLESLLSSLPTGSETATVTPQPQPPLDALTLASDAASLIKAHATKISLFIITEPFTPSAIVTVLRALHTGNALPGLASAVQACTPARYTTLVHSELQFRVGKVLRGFRELVEKVPRDGKVLTGDAKNATGGGRGALTGPGAKKGGGAGQGSIAATGVLWSACDDVIALAKMGVAGLLVQKVEQFRDTLKDVMEELKEWAEEEDEDDGDEDDDHGGHADQNGQLAGGGVDGITNTLSETHISTTQAMLDDLMNSQPHIPRDDPDKIRERLDSCLRRLRLTTLLYQAVVKRRLKASSGLQLPTPLPTPDMTSTSPSSNVAARLDEVIPLLRRIPERFTSLALAFYELDPIEIDQHMDQCFFDAFAVAELLAKPWGASKERDEFTDWTAKFQVEIKKV